MLTVDLRPEPPSPPPDSWEIPRGAELRATVALLREGREVSDDAFDRVFPEPVRTFSSVHWTQVAVILRALRMLGANENTRILDVGSGAGKFCVVGGLVSRARFVGVEQRQPLVDVARALAAEYGVANATFVQGAAERLDWSGYDAIYLYNPFGELNLAPRDRISCDGELPRERYSYLVRATQARLYLAAPGTRVVTFHGLGGPMPPGYRCLESERWYQGALSSFVRLPHDQELLLGDRNGRASETSPSATDLFGEQD